MFKIMIYVMISLCSFSIYAKNLKQATEHDYITERYYLGLDSDRVIEQKMQQVRARGDIKAQVNVICVDTLNFYKNLIALNQANRHFNYKTIDAETRTYKKLLNGLE